MFDELFVKECEDAEKKAEEGKVIKRRKLSEPHQLTLVELKEPYPEYIKVTKRIAEMITIDTQPFSIAEDTGFIQLQAYVCP